MIEVLDGCGLHPVDGHGGGVDNSFSMCEKRTSGQTVFSNLDLRNCVEYCHDDQTVVRRRDFEPA
jgi:hypothetical protein